MPMRARKAVPALDSFEVVGDVEVGAPLSVECCVVFCMLMESECELREVLCWAKRAE